MLDDQRDALRQALEELGYPVDGAVLQQAFKRFKEIADKKRVATDILEAAARAHVRALSLAVRRGQSAEPEPEAVPAP